MKRRIFSILAMLAMLCLLSACFPEPQTVKDEEEEQPPEKKQRVLPESITLKLSDAGEYADDVIGISFSADINENRAGAISVSDSRAGANRAGTSANGANRAGTERALTNEVAQAFHDIFEAVFYYTGTGGVNRTVARAVWNVGETPELRGVYRTGNKATAGSGVNYGNYNSQAAANDTGYAMLFAGANEDKTLLAVGRLIQVDGVNGTMLFTDSTSVTFEVAALVAGTKLNANKTDSSFFTNFGSTGTNIDSQITEIKNVAIHYVGNKTFPLYMLNRSDGIGGGTARANTSAEYTFSTVGSGPTFTNYAAGIVLAGGYNYEVRNPRYIITDGLYQYSSIFVQDIRSGLATMGAANIRAAGYITDPSNPPTPPTLGYFQNPVTFTFDTTGSPAGSIFALAFEIFVYNLTPRPTSTASLSDNNTNAIKWRISPGMGTKWLDLDDGSGGEGGAILLGSGNIDAWMSNVPGS